MRLSSGDHYERLMMVLAYPFLMAVGAQAERDGQHREVSPALVQA